ncbi:MAG TPA: hypothetical protein VHO70_01085 [Chitinispirillaceae bacterium]|nr:hypothetical protein [Chitinispirillaceae bacterium]
MAKFVCEGIAELKSDENMAKLAALLKPQFKIGVTANKANIGMITENGNSFPEGVSITLKVKENSGEKFLGWFDASGKSVSTSNNYNFTMKEGDVSFVACFQGGKDIVKIGEVGNMPKSGLSFNHSNGSLYYSKPYKIMHIDIFSIDGRRVFSKVHNAEMGDGMVKMPIDEIKSGSYILKTTVDGIECINNFTKLQ